MKKLTLIFAAIFTIAFNNIYSQITFEKTYGGAGYDYGSSVQQTSDGGYIISVTTESLNAGCSGDYCSDVYLIKTNANGDTLWTKTFDGTNGDYGNSVQQTSDGGYIIAGTTNRLSGGFSDVYLIKTNNVGDLLWSKTFGGAFSEYGYSVQQTSDGGYIITGYFNTSSGGDSSLVYLIKTDNNGNTVWTKTLGNGSGLSVQQTSDGGYIVAGYFRISGLSDTDLYLIKTNNNGDTLWTKTFGGINNELGNSVQQTSDGGYIVAGQTESFGAGIGDVYLIKTNNIGDTLWTKTYGGTGGENGSSVQQTSDGGYIIAGFTQNFGGVFEEFFLIKTDANGDSLWTKTFGTTTGFEYANSVQQTSDGGYIITGSTQSYITFNIDVYLIKTDANGNINLATNINEQTNNALKVNAFPNPTSNQLYISLTQQDNQPILYQINNTLGATIITYKATTKEFNIDVSTLPTGIYFIHLQSGNAQTVKKFIKE